MAIVYTNRIHRNTAHLRLHKVRQQAKDIKVQSPNDPRGQTGQENYNARALVKQVLRDAKLEDAPMATPARTPVLPPTTPKAAATKPTTATPAQALLNSASKTGIPRPRTLSCFAFSELPRQRRPRRTWTRLVVPSENEGRH